MYEIMKIWQTPDVIPGLTPAMMEFARIWQEADKIVYSKSLETVSTPKTRLEREFEPQAVRDLKAQLPHDISVAGPNLAAQAIRAGLVDEYQLLVIPIMLGGGKRVLPSNVGVKLDLLDERRVGNGWVYLRYRTRV
jgi:dihydrofolate reductase